jgi:O-6-methylguanine DNA methyltransferase
MSNPECISLAIPTREGTFIATYSDAGLAAIDFPGRRKAPPAAWHKLVTKAIQATLTGAAPGELPPLDVRSGTEFQQRVWEELLRIPTGHTRAYGELARVLRKPGAARAVGSACGSNPIPLLIPCHRVLAANGRLGGFSGGLDWKRRLLAVEGVSAN